LPISSSGHLAIINNLIGIEAGLSLYTILHLGTLLSVLVFFREDILKMLNRVLNLDFRSDSGKLFLMIIVGTLPVLLAGLSLYNMVDAAFSDMRYVGASLIFTGIVLFSTRRVKQGKRKLDYRDAVVMGLAQALAIFPGVSRSGLTVSAGIMRKVDREKAFKFSFLLSIPAIIGANMYELYRELRIGGYSANMLEYISGSFNFGYEMLIGAFVSFMVGYWSLGFVKKMVLEKKLHYFAYYCWLLGILLIAFVSVYTF